MQMVLAITGPQEATALNHTSLGTHHFLLGLLQEGNPAEPILRNCGINALMVRSMTEHIEGRGDKIVSGRIPLTQRAGKTLGLTIDEATRLGHPQVNSLHLLLVLIRNGVGLAAYILDVKGVSSDKIQQAVNSDSHSNYGLNP